MQINNYTFLTHDIVFSWCKLASDIMSYYVTKFIEIFPYQGFKYYTLLIYFVMKKKKVNKDIIA